MFAWMAIRLLLLAVVIGVVAELVPGIEVNGGFGALLWISVLFSLVNAVLGPVFKLVSLPLIVMYLYFFIDTITDSAPGSLIPNAITFRHWDFLWQARGNRPSIWPVALNTLVFATTVTITPLAS